MERQRWQRVRELFHAAVEMSSERRAAYLAEECDGDVELRREVESLLRSHEGADSFLAVPTLVWGEDEEPDRPDPYEGRTLGAYRVLHRIGRGGMAVVYLAVRADDEFQKRVAVKVLKPGTGSEEIVRRFRTERQILASLDHPHIARLLDGGSTEEGLPYFVLEHVEGMPILQYCRERGLSTTQRLALFRRVCAAVQFAHQNLVVHRDLKPGNVLVTADGTPKLLDFGIAKLLNPELSGQPQVYTYLGRRLLTPEYASPEQVRGERITTASDVYSLGVMLYELLTGQNPHRPAEGGSGELERTILEVEPRRPSTVVARREREAPAAGAGLPVGGRHDLDPRKLRRELSGDLDQIALKALRKEPQHRYSSAQQLSEDVERYLEGLPVLARRGTVTYRIGKFVRRHRVGVAAAATLALALLIFGALMAWQRVEIAHQRDRAEQERARAEEVTDFLVGLFEASDPFSPADPAITARELLQRGAERVATQLEDQPRTQATLLDTLGVIHLDLGLYPEARPLLTRALELRRRTLGEEHPQVAESLNHLAVLLREEGDHAGAEELLHRALELHRGRSEDGDPALAESLNDLGVLLQHQGEHEAAADHFRQALAIRRETLGAEHPDTVATLNNLSAATYSVGDLAQAEQLFRQSLALHREILGDDHPMVAVNLNNLAVVLQKQGEDGEARRFFEQALDLRRRLLGPRHPEVANSLYNLADLMADAGDFAAAEPLAREGLEILRDTLAEDDWRVSLLRSLLGRCLAGLGRYRQAEPLLLESLAVLRARRGEEDRHTQATLRRLVELYEAWGRPGEAARYRAQLE